MPLDLLHPGGLTTALIPDIVLAVGTMILLVYGAAVTPTPALQRRVGIGSVVVLALTFAAVVLVALRGYTAAGGPIAVDNFRWAADGVLLIGALLTILIAIEFQEREGIATPESHVLVLLATSGMMLLVAARDLTLVFLGIELMSIAVYALVAVNRRSARSAEGALKYFLLGAFSTAFMLYGMALVYGATGSTSFAGIAQALTTEAALGSPNPVLGWARRPPERPPLDPSQEGTRPCCYPETRRQTSRRPVASTPPSISTPPPGGTSRCASSRPRGSSSPRACRRKCPGGPTGST